MRMCPKCKTVTSEDVCPNCGEFLAVTKRETENIREEMSVHGEPLTEDRGDRQYSYNSHAEVNEDKLLRRFVGEKKADKYAGRFQKIDEGKITLNVCALLFGYFWLLYRKMFKEAAAFIAVTSIIGSIGTLLAKVLSIDNTGTISGFFAMLTWAFMGFYGDRIYKSKYEYVASLPPEEQEEYLEKNAGASVGSIFKGFFIIIGLLLLFSFIVGMAISIPMVLLK